MLVCGRALALLVALAGCSRAPHPDSGHESFVHALERCDEAAIYAQLTEEAQNQLGPSGVTALCQRDRSGLERRAQELASAQQLAARARLQFHAGEQAELQATSDGHYAIDGVDSLPLGATTVEGALTAFRGALVRRSYPALTRTLTKRAAADMESELRSLTTGLGDLDAARIEVNDSVATATITGGHQVRLRREQGVWRIEDFD